MFENTAICGTIQLGKRGENKARRIRFDEPSRWEEIFGAGTYELIHQRSGDTAPYPVALQYEAGAVYWVVSASDTAIEGEGKCELRYIVNDTVVKSQTWKTVVSEGLGEASAEAPAPYTDWVDEVLNADVSAKESAIQAVEAANKAETAKALTEKYAEQTATHAKNVAENTEYADLRAKDSGVSSMTAQAAAEEARRSATELTGMYGDLNEALDRIIDIQNSLIGGDAI